MIKTVDFCNKLRHDDTSFYFVAFSMKIISSVVEEEKFFAKNNEEHQLIKMSIKWRASHHMTILIFLTSYTNQVFFLSFFTLSNEV